VGEWASGQYPKKVRTSFHQLIKLTCHGARQEKNMSEVFGIILWSKMIVIFRT
jgi:hypothetical protein